MTFRRCLIELPTSKVLNSNSLPKNTFVKSQKVNHIRQLGQQWGIEHHNTPDISQEHVNAIGQLKELKTQKTRATKNAKKSGISEENQQELIDAIESQRQNIILPDIDYLFDFFKVTVAVCPPTRQKVDPPNLYPTIKPFVDGLTDAGWWEDDNFTQLLSMNFIYGGLSGTKGYLIVLDIESTDKNDYIVESIGKRSELWQMKTR